MRLITFLAPDGRTYISDRQAGFDDVAVPDKPSEEHVFDRQEFIWKLTLPSLQQAQEQAFELIRKARNTRLEQGGLVWNGWLVSIDKEATDRMTSTAVQFIAGVISQVRWKMSDGEYATLDKEAFFAMSAAAGLAVQQCYAVEESKRQAVLDLADVKAVIAWLGSVENIYTGWPGDEA